MFGAARLKPRKLRAELMDPLESFAHRELTVAAAARGLPFSLGREICTGGDSLLHMLSVKGPLTAPAVALPPPAPEPVAELTPHDPADHRQIGWAAGARVRPAGQPR